MKESKMQTVGTGYGMARPASAADRERAARKRAEEEKRIAALGPPRTTYDLSLNLRTQFAWFYEPVGYGSDLYQKMIQEDHNILPDVERLFNVWTEGKDIMDRGGIKALYEWKSVRTSIHQDSEAYIEACLRGTVYTHLQFHYFDNIERTDCPIGKTVTLFHLVRPVNRGKATPKTTTREVWAAAKRLLTDPVDQSFYIKRGGWTSFLKAVATEVGGVDTQTVRRHLHEALNRSAHNITAVFPDEIFVKLHKKRIARLRRLFNKS